MKNSSFVSLPIPLQSSERFAQEICRALADMKHLFEEYRSLQKKNPSNGTKSDKPQAK